MYRFHRRYKYYIAGNVTSIFSSTIVIVNAKWLQSILIIYTIERIALGHILFESLHILTHASLSRVCWVQVSNSYLGILRRDKLIEPTVVIQPWVISFQSEIYNHYTPVKI